MGYPTPEQREQWKGITPSTPPIGPAAASSTDRKGDAPEPVTIERHELHTLLAVARMYLDAFADDHLASVTELWAHQHVRDVVEKYGPASAVQPDPGSST